MFKVGEVGKSLFSFLINSSGTTPMGQGEGDVGALGSCLWGDGRPWKFLCSKSRSLKTFETCWGALGHAQHLQVSSPEASVCLLPCFFKLYLSSRS